MKNKYGSVRQNESLLGLDSDFPSLFYEIGIGQVRYTVKNVIILIH